MPNHSKGNFDFLNEKNPELMHLMYDVELLMKTDLADAGARLRSAISRFLDDVISREKGKISPKDSTIGKQVKYLEDERLIHKLQKKGDEQDYLLVFKDTKKGKVKYRLVSSVSVKKASKSGSDDWRCTSLNCAREIANQCVHYKEYPDEIVNRLITFDRLIQAVFCIRNVMGWYYYPDVNNLYPYDQSIMRIDKYVIIQGSRVSPVDSEITGCDREYIGYCDDDSSETKFAIIRQYRKDENTDWESLTKRIHDVNTQSWEAFEEDNDTRPAFASVSEICSRRANPITNFYLIAYEFRYEPEFLANVDLINISIENRLRICFSIAQLFSKLHNSTTPISHRFLTYESITLHKKESGRYYPYVIKFDFAKIERPDYLTVMPNEKIVKAREFISKRESGYQKYFAPEWDSINLDSMRTKPMDWAAVDAFALSVLFCDILYGNIADDLVDLELLSEIGYTDSLISALEDSMCFSPEERGTSEDLALALQKEISSTRRN